MALGCSLIMGPWITGASCPGHIYPPTSTITWARNRPLLCLGHYAFLELLAVRVRLFYLTNEIQSKIQVFLLTNTPIALRDWMCNAQLTPIQEGMTVYFVEAITMGVQLAHSLFQKMRPVRPEFWLLSTLAFSLGWYFNLHQVLLCLSLQMIVQELWRGEAQAGRTPSPDN